MFHSRKKAKGLQMLTINGFVETVWSDLACVVESQASTRFNYFMPLPGFYIIYLFIYLWDDEVCETGPSGAHRNGFLPQASCGSTDARLCHICKHVCVQPDGWDNEDDQT